MRAVPYLRVARRTAALALLAAGCGGGEGPAPVDPLDHPDVLDLMGTPDSARDASVSAFADQGAWHMFALPDPGAGDVLGGFTGPFLLTDGGVWLGRSVAGFRVWADDGDQPLVWEPRGDAAVRSYPGRLVQ
ncbi:MAG TPA: hypothetical protein VLA43_20700, partial [Longimicrobiales bacterium]|nr:hypothetical protein [Longimicrobiales bacterium]